MEISSLIRQGGGRFETICTAFESAHIDHYCGERDSFADILCFLLGVLCKPNLETENVYRQIAIETAVLLSNDKNINRVDIYQCRHSGEKDVFQAYEKVPDGVNALYASSKLIETVEFFLDPSLNFGRIFLHLFPLSGRAGKKAGRRFDKISSGSFTAGFECVSSPRKKT
jgi:hypothetical protein